ncbi:hemerythrin HHE cation binding domain-containing protein [Purpureocillium lilacinum]|uniref:Hemerythrin HHE cation binding domain-containing protein n=1 Tax=Purpureocillium lilacinum TaxID=33203 RepID=A0A179HH25_PURLI|nr:hemerythrin HHE cation binding domain-containing protein [Purpureocillium lilacinum]OAQ88871.1 hemerythrin HHE cation binding domain-containing protein [Purpureocillium lilacinum]
MLYTLVTGIVSVAIGTYLLGTHRQATIMPAASETNGAMKKPWADAPLALIPTPTFLTNKTDMWTEGASHMCNLHNAIFRGYNSMYLQAPHVRDADKADFLGYCRTWSKFVRTHADKEEGELFPDAERLLKDEVFKHTHEEHGRSHPLFNAFIPALNEFHEYLESVKATPSQFSTARMLELMAAFEKPFEEHFRSEIDTIAALAAHPNTPREGTPEAATAKSRFDAWGRRSVLTGGVTDVSMFFLFNLDRGYEGGLWSDWPEVPAALRWALTRTLGGWHSGWWRFASCDADGRPRELYALP